MEKYDFSRETHYAVGVFVIDKGRILLLKQSRSPFWLLPGGHIDDNELPHEAAIRETGEETGLNIEILEKANDESKTRIVAPIPLPHHMQVLPCRDKRDVNMVFTARVLFGKLRINEESKEARWFTGQEILDAPEVGPNTKYHAIRILKEHSNV